MIVRTVEIFVEFNDETLEEGREFSLHSVRIICPVILQIMDHLKTASTIQLAA